MAIKVTATLYPKFETSRALRNITLFESIYTKHHLIMSEHTTSIVQQDLEKGNSDFY